MMNASELIPKFKKRCIICGKYTAIKGGWNYCMKCWEKKYGRYKGADRHLYVNSKS